MTYNPVSTSAAPTSNAEDSNHIDDEDSGENKDSKEDEKDGNEEDDNAVEGNDNIPDNIAEDVVLDRYPVVFEQLKKLLEDGKTKKTLKLLSFGCSNGTQSHTLRRYFPTAILDGVDILDISDEVIAKSNASKTDPKERYYDTVDNLPAKSYDAVLAMNVLTVKAKEEPLKHSKFVETVRLLDRLLLPGGYLVIYNADYPFSESPRHAYYENMCTYNNSKHIVPAVDMFRHHPSIRNVGAVAAAAGRCSFLDPYCIESGWRRKFNAEGDQVQEPGEVSKFNVGGHMVENGNETMLMSHGCRYPGTFFKKLQVRLVS